jgi:hypothetical protein
MSKGRRNTIFMRAKSRRSDENEGRTAVCQRCVCVEGTFFSIVVSYVLFVV